MNSKYAILALVAGSESAHEYKNAKTLRDARGIALRLAEEYTPDWVKTRPVWCDAGAWNEHPDADGMMPVGGYDCGDDGSAAVIFAKAIAA